MLDHLIEVYFDTIDSNNDDQIELSLNDIVFNIKTDFLQPLIKEYWSYFGDDHDIKPLNF